MPRVMSTAMLAALTSPEIYPAIFVEANFETGPVYLWSGFGSIVWGGNTWTGIGSMGSISTISEGTAVEARGVVLKLSGIDPVLLPAVLGEFLLGAPAIAYLGLFSPGTPTSLIANPIVIFSGRMDQPALEIGGQTASIAIACEGLLVEMNTAVDRRYTPDDQQRDWPGDLGMNFVYGIQELNIYFGGAPTSSGNL